MNECKNCGMKFQDNSEFGDHEYCSKNCNNEYIKNLVEELNEIDPIKPNLSKGEESYRRGYCHGFLAARRNENLSDKEVYAWRHSRETVAPPGSALEGQHMHGLTEDEEHRFFINRLDPPIKKGDLS